MSDDNVVPFNGDTTLDLNPEMVLEEAKKQDLEKALVIGYVADGSLYFASSSGDLHLALWILEQAKRALLDFDR